MNIKSIGSQPYFSAQLNNNTRNLIKKADRSYGMGLEKKLDGAINCSALKNFNDGNADITVGLYDSWEGDRKVTRACAMINSDMRGQRISAPIPNGNPDYKYDTDEKDVVEVLSISLEHMTNVLLSVKNTTTETIKKTLAREYIKQNNYTCPTEVSASDYDKIISGKLII